YLLGAAHLLGIVHPVLAFFHGHGVQGDPVVLVAMEEFQILVLATILLGELHGIAGSLWVIGLVLLELAHLIEAHAHVQERQRIAPGIILQRIVLGLHQALVVILVHIQHQKVVVHVFLGCGSKVE